MNSKNIVSSGGLFSDSIIMNDIRLNNDVCENAKSITPPRISSVIMDV